MNSMKTTPLHKLFSKQQPKVKHTRRKAAFLKVHANNDVTVFVPLIKKWLDEDEKRVRNKHKK